MDDEELNRLLREWKAPDAPPHLQPPRHGSGWLAWLLSGRIRVPVPVALAALVLLSLSTASAWALSRRAVVSPPDPTTLRPSGERARYPLTGPLEGFDAVLIELNFRPGVSSPEHRHPGFIVGYVVDGQLRTAINHDPDQVVPTGGTFYEPHGSLHTAFGSANADAPARAVAFMVVPTGSPLTVPR